MFAQSAALLFFISKKLANRKPFQRFPEFPLVCRSNAGKRGSELGAQRNFALAFVGKIEKLIDDFGPTLFAIEIGWFEDWSVPLDKTVAPGGLAPFGEDEVSPGAIVRKKIAKAGQWLHDDFLTQ